MNDPSFATRRAPAAPDTGDGSPDPDARFRTLVQSPLRAGLVRFLFARPHDTFDVDALMSTFGQMRRDVENCLNELTAGGLVARIGSAPAVYRAQAPDREPVAQLLDAFLEGRATVSLEDQSPSVQRFREMIGRDEKMLVVFEWIRTAAKSDIAVLILGPTGSGKEVVARMIHELSHRGPENFQTLNCAAVPDELFEAEVFGVEKGAVVGATDRKPGRVELADRGTLFLDEIGDLSLVAQSKLLRVLEERRFERLGGQKAIHVDFRLISATNRPLDQFVRDERFREDLYYRVNAFAIRLPSLRERAIDIPVLAERFLARYCAVNGMPLDGKTFSAEAISRLQAHPWPGNIRELESTVARAALSASGRSIRGSDVEFLHMAPSVAATGPTVRVPTLRDVERAHIVRVLERTAWNKKEAARLLDISRGTLYRKIVEFGLEPAMRQADTPAEHPGHPGDHHGA